MTKTVSTNLPDRAVIMFNNYALKSGKKQSYFVTLLLIVENDRVSSERNSLIPPKKIDAIKTKGVDLEA